MRTFTLSKRCWRRSTPSSPTRSGASATSSATGRSRTSAAGWCASAPRCPSAATTTSACSARFDLADSRRRRGASRRAGLEPCSPTKSEPGSRRLSPLAVGDGAQLFHASPRDPIWEYVLSDHVALLSLQRRPHRSSSSATATSRCGGSRRRDVQRRRRLGGTETALEGSPPPAQPGLGRPAARRGPARRVASTRLRRQGSLASGARPTTSSRRKRRSPRRTATRAGATPRPRHLGLDAQTRTHGWCVRRGAARPGRACRGTAYAAPAPNDLLALNQLRLAHPAGTPIRVKPLASQLPQALRSRCRS